MVAALYVVIRRHKLDGPVTQPTGPFGFFSTSCKLEECNKNKPLHLVTVWSHREVRQSIWAKETSWILIPNMIKVSETRRIYRKDFTLT